MPQPLRRADPKPLAISLGDPCGIGPEIIVKAWQALRTTGPHFVVIGDFQSLASIDSNVPIERVSTPAQAAEVFGRALPLLDQPIGSAVAPAIIGWIETGVALALAGEVSGLITAPIAKASLYAAGFGFPGHTEFLGELTAASPYNGVRGPIMMLAVEGLRTTLVSVHTPLSQVAAALTSDKIIHAAQVTAQALIADFGVADPRIAIAGLNPHAGEGGGIGREEIEIIAPAVASLRALGLNVTGPHPADSLFHAAARKTFDAVVCMYHDQALIPVKMLDFWGGVNITLGLPIVRTSPDHGTAFDIAGQGIARPDSLIAAIHAARDIAACRAK
jgi:4-hydroxythreonine-4-phosphate dehydrogenase